MRYFHRLKIPLLSISLISGVIVFLYLLHFLYIGEQGNFHIVTKEQVYRSAQLDEDELFYYIRKYHIKSILNLRGKHPNSRWYQKEVKISQKMGVVHYDYGILATHEVSKKEINKILRILLNAPKPVLIHCKKGADRSGLLSAVWKYAIEGKSAQEASRQLSPRYGHFPYLWSETKDMDKSFWRFVKEYENGYQKKFLQD